MSLSDIYRAAALTTFSLIGIPSARRAANVSIRTLGQRGHAIAGFYAHAQTLATLFELGMVLSESVANATALSGRLDILQHIIAQQQCPRPVKLSYYAARSGNISMLDWLKAQSWCAFNDDTCAGAAEGGHLAALQHIRSDGCSWEEDSIACDAARGGSIEVLDWLRQQQQGIDIDATVMMMAAFGGQTAMCQHLRSIGCSWDAGACDQAADFGHFDTLRWLREHGCPWDVSTVCLNAAFCGSIDILEYILEQGEILEAELLTKALNMAGALDQLQTAQWLRQHGAQWPAALSSGGRKLWSRNMIVGTSRGLYITCYTMTHCFFRYVRTRYLCSLHCKYCCDGHCRGRT
jgi:hypothetical protein